ncbi:MAG: hypothetical protein ACKVIH_01650 [Burkholderiales bacterium]
MSAAEHTALAPAVQDDDDLDAPDSFARPSIQRTVPAASAPRHLVDGGGWAKQAWCFGATPLTDQLAQTDPPESPAQPINPPTAHNLPPPEPTMPTQQDSTVSDRFKACSTLAASGPMSTAELARLTGIASGVLSKAAYAWRVKGLIDRQKDGLLAITDAGRAYVNGDTPSADTGLGQMFKERTAKKRGQAARVAAAGIEPDAEAAEAEEPAEPDGQAEAIGITTWADNTYTLTVGEQHVSLSAADIRALRSLLQSPSF